MVPRQNHRQIWFFLVAVLLPCSVLVGLSLRMMRQDRELAAKRLTEERERVAATLRQELLGALERIKYEEASALTAGDDDVRARWSEDATVVLVAQLDDDRPVMPWEEVVAHAGGLPGRDNPDFTARVREGERLEYDDKDPGKARAAYAGALEVAAQSAESAYAKLLLARVYAKSGQDSEAEQLYRDALDCAGEALDEHGIPLTYYAAAGLLEIGKAYPAVLDRLQGVNGPCAPAALYLSRDLLRTLEQSAAAPQAMAAATLGGKVQARIQLLEQALALQRDFPGLGLGKSLVGSSAKPEPLWVPYADNRWWVSVAPAVGRSPAVLVVVRVQDVLALLKDALAGTDSGMGARRIVIGDDPEGELLGAELPGVRVVFALRPEEILAQQWSAQRGFYVVSLLLILSVTLFAAYLLWRDVQRELRLANLRSQFVSSVSHELKTPLTAIRMFAETLLLRRTQAPQAQGEYLETIVNETQRLTRLLNNVLDFSKIEQGKKLYRTEPTILAQAIQAAATAMQYPLAQQGFRLQVRIENDLPAMRVDADAIEQAVLNLLTNAMKYSGDSRDIMLTLRRSDRHGLIEVRDHGIGISPADQAHIFEKFYRVAAAPRVPGTGLGLTLVQHIARAHGGDVEVASELGKGSTFTIRIPVEEPI